MRIGCNAFAGTALQRVWFNGDNPPAFTQAPDTFGFGTANTAEGAITFYVRETPGWAEILAEADANDGLVAASRFNTKQRQRVARFTGFVYIPANNENDVVSIFDTRFVEKYNERVTFSSADFPYTAQGVRLFPLTFSASCSTDADALGR